MLQDDHLYYDSLNNKVLLSNNRQKQALFDKLLSHRYLGNITGWIQRATCPSELYRLVQSSRKKAACSFTSSSLHCM